MAQINYWVKNKDADNYVGSHGCPYSAIDSSSGAAIFKVNPGQGATGICVTTDEEREEATAIAGRTLRVLHHLKNTGIQSHQTNAE